MKKVFRNIKWWWKHNIGTHIDSFFWEYHGNDVCGPGYQWYRTFKTGNLALLISILTVIGLVLYIILS
jgi:hypothetical protein